MPQIVEMVETGQHEKITEELCQELLGLTEDDNVCTLGASDLQIEWLPQGQRFAIREYDGSESILTQDIRIFIA